MQPHSVRRRPPVRYRPRDDGSSTVVLRITLKPRRIDQETPGKPRFLRLTLPQGSKWRWTIRRPLFGVAKERFCFPVTGLSFLSRLRRSGLLERDDGSRFICSIKARHSLRRVSATRAGGATARAGPLSAAATVSRSAAGHRKQYPLHLSGRSRRRNQHPPEILASCS